MPQKIPGLEWHESEGNPAGLILVRGNPHLCGHIMVGSVMHRFLEEAARHSSKLHLSVKHTLDDGSVTRDVGPNRRAVLIPVLGQDQVAVTFEWFYNLIRGQAPQLSLAPAIAIA